MTPVEPAPRVLERERVVDQVIEPEFDPRFALASLEDSVRSLRTAVVLLGLVSLAALALGLYALLRADEADRTDNTRSGASQSEVSSLEDRIDELESDTRGTAESGDVDAVQKALDDKADAKDIAALEKAIQDLQDQPAPEPAEAEPDAETVQAINDINTRLDDLEKRVEAAEAQAP